MVWVVDANAQEMGTTAATTFFALVERVLASPRIYRLAFDCEGVRLGRNGSIEVVSLCFEDQSQAIKVPEIYLVDLADASSANGKKFHHLRVQALKLLFECSELRKVIHDCRVDSDALYHLCDIRLSNIHDTSCFHQVISGEDFKNLNYVLSYNGIPTNVTRDNSVYKYNPSFWARRPLSQRMIDWASSDVDKLLQIATKQENRLLQRGGRGNLAMKSAISMSNESIASYRDMKCASGIRCRISHGQFMGRGGGNIKRVQLMSGTGIKYRDGIGWEVCYKHQHQLDHVKREMGY